MSIRFDKPTTETVDLAFDMLGISRQLRFVKMRFLEPAFYKLEPVMDYDATLSVDGEELPSDEIFFAGIFDDAELTVLSRMVEEPILALLMDGESSTSAMTNVQIVPGETVTLYITEVDEEGNPVSEDPDFVYEVTVDQDSVSIDMDHQAATVTIINQEKPEPTPTPEPTETPEPTATPTPAPTATVTNAPASPGARTGDATDTAGYLAMLLLAGMVLLTSGLLRKRKE